MTYPRIKRLRWHSALAVLLLWAFFAQAVTSMVVQSTTVDEQAHLMRGYLYLKLGKPVFKIGHPILADTLAAVPLWALTNLDIPADENAFATNDWGNYSDYFVWRPGNNVDLIFFLSRLPTVALGMLFAALAFRWARQVWSGGAGLVALSLYVFDPTMVAHSQLVTHDVPVGCFYFAATYCLWRYLETNRVRDLVLSGIVFGLAQGSKFSALILVPVFIGMVGLWPFLPGNCSTGRPHWLMNRIASLLAIFGIGGLTIWALYHFDVRSLPGLGLPVPAPAYFDDLLWELKYFGRHRYFFLCGDYSATGWWYYLPLAFALKTPLPALILIGAALFNLPRKAHWPRLTALLLPLSAYLLSTLVSPLYIGYRYFIPALPYLYVATGRLAVLAKQHWRFLLAGTLIWSAVIASRIYPDSMAYFNELAGGPDNGWRCLVDSNIDWGQSLPALRDLVKQYRLGRIKLSYFGSAHPSYYGLDFEPLPTADLTPERGNPLTNTFYPHAPAPGIYAISATNLQGVAMEPDKWNTYAWFRDKIPFAKAGYSIFLYRVEPTGPPLDVNLSGLQIDELAPASFATFNTNDVRLRWFDSRTSFVVPSQSAWYVLSAGDLSSWGWNSRLPCVTTTGQNCLLYPPDLASHAAILDRVERLGTTSRAWLQDLALANQTDQSLLSFPVNLGDQIQFLGYEKLGPSVISASATLLTAWRITAPPSSNRAIFAHLLGRDGSLLAQWDGVDVAVEGWRTGDTLIQQVSLPLPPTLSPGQYWIQIGVYNPETMERLPVLVSGRFVADRILLEPVSWKMP